MLWDLAASRESDMRLKPHTKPGLYKARAIKSILFERVEYEASEEFGVEIRRFRRHLFQVPSYPFHMSHCGWWHQYGNLTGFRCERFCHLIEQVNILACKRSDLLLREDSIDHQFVQHTHTEFTRPVFALLGQPILRMTLRSRSFATNHRPSATVPNPRIDCEPSIRM